ncbi:tetratricopeptide repeat protein [Ekhidna lutea]|uniref:tetratricopeptide repeat protein n=1 Tax=Ekhidna lutea TaxID=447679 RepID=UPI0015C63703|nr:tetratricopeptide repeat protein [Ekhidna lutea]
MRIQTLLLFVLFTSSVFAQNSVSKKDFSGLEAFEAFQERQYSQVKEVLDAKNALTTDEQILLNLSQLKTGNSNGDAIEKWLVKNPNHPMRPLASFHLGEYFFYSKDSIKAQKYLKDVSPSELSKRDKASYGFVYGVLQLEGERYNSAKNLFGLAKSNGFDDQLMLTYYQSFTEYHLGNTDEALEGFLKVQGSDTYGNSSKFFIAKIWLEQGRITEVIQLAQNEISDTKSITNSGFHQLVGEAYALENNAAKADAYFERAIQLHPEKPNAALYYQAGVSKFKIGNEKKAIEYLTEAGIQGGEYAQLSALQLGRLYVKEGHFEKALTAYIESSASTNAAIKEESYFHAASLNAKLGFYAEAINYGNDYLKRYGDNKRAEAIQDLIAQSYLKTSNYDLAIEQLRNAGISNNIQREVYQKVTFQKAILSFNDADFVAAKDWFRESLKYPSDQQLKDESNYYLAELALRDNKYDLAITLYNRQSKVNDLSRYGLGYAYYNQEQYQKAKQYFQGVRTSDQKVNMDAKVRLADCHYATKSYQDALNLYNQLLSQMSSPYLYFQKGLCLKNLGKGNEAINAFERVYANAAYGARARFQSGMIHFESAKFSEAIPYFTYIITNQSADPLVSESLLNRAICYKNNGQLKESQQDFERILQQHIQSNAALNAILGLQELDQAGQEINKLSSFIAAYKEANPDNGSLELIEFEAAKRLYFDFSYQAAADAFEKFLVDYPASGNKTEAKYYIADSYYRIQDFERALPLFDELKYVRNELTGRVLTRLGDINSKLGNVKAAADAYQLLIDLSLSAKDSYNAKQGLMQLHYNHQQFNKAIDWANNIIGSDWKPINGEQEALLIKGRSWYHLSNYEESMQSFQKLSEGKDVYAAESNYFLGLIAFEKAEYDESLNLLFDLNANLGSYTEWVDRSYLLIAKNYLAKDELFQAKATLRSIIEHAKIQEVKNEATKLINEIESNTQTNDSTQNKE